MAKASADDSQRDNGELLINTGTGGPQISRAVVAAGAQAQQARTVGGAIAGLVSWFFISTGTNTIDATGRGARVAGGAGSVIVDGAAYVSTNTAGAVNTTLTQPWRPAGGAFSDQMPVPSASRFVFKTGTDTINGDRGAQIAGGAGSVVATGAATVNTSNAGAVNTTGALAQFSRKAAGAFSDQMLTQREFVLESSSSTDRATASGIVIKAKTGSTINFGTGAQIASAGAVIADGAAAVNTHSAGAVNVYEERSSNIYCSAVVVGPTCLMIGVGLGITVCSSKKLGAGVVLAVGFSLKRKVRWWATRLIKKIKDEL